MSYSKEEILSNLYALRAGMSVISIEKDKADELNATISAFEAQTKGEIAALKDRLTVYHQDYRQTSTNLEQLKLEIKYSLTPQEQYTQQLTRALIKLFFKSFIGIIILALTGFFIYMFYKSYIQNPDDLKTVFPKYTDLANVICIISPLLIIGCAILFIKYIHTLIVEKNAFGFPPSLKSLKAELNAKYNAISNCEKHIQIFKKNIAVLKEKIAKTKEQSNIDIKKEKQNVKLLIRESSIFYQVLKTTHEEFLDIRDWQHIDLLIYYFETGRADDLKEALLLVDKQNQNNALINAIQDASSNISTTIKEGLQNLQNGLAKSFSLISKQISSMQLQLQEQMTLAHKQHQEQMTLAHKQLEGLLKISNHTSMNNALIAKANIDSVNLMKDVNRMKEIAEYNARHKGYNF